MRRWLSAALPAWLAVCLCGVGTIWSTRLALGESAGSARVSRVLQDVKVDAGTGKSRPAKIGDVLPAGSVVRTGNEARAEITLPGGSVARLGGKSVLKIGGNARELDLQEGLALFQVSRRAPTLKLTTGSINVSARAGTGLIERNGKAYVKILLLEGESRVYTKRLGESIVMMPGQLLITNPATAGLPEPVHFAIEQLYKTSLLLNSGFAPLASRAAILQAIEKQKNDPRFVPTNLMIYGRGTLVNLLPPSPSPSPRGSPVPAKP